ncbi:type II secretion system F family protein [Candidatus Woesearchaeota archaeon]|nr:type II secretion system F family protein [Candidatus Woesearchaeota archaeon]
MKTVWKKEKVSFNEKLGDFLIPPKVRPHLREELLAIGLHRIPHKLISYIFYVLAVLSVILISALFMTILTGKSMLFYIIISPILYAVFLSLLMLLTYGMYKVLYNNRYYHILEEIDLALPEFLTELNLHLRSGMTLKKALETSTNPEFGILNDILKDIIVEIKMGSEISQAFKKASNRYRSRHLVEALNLISASSEDGGKTISLIDRLIDNINTYHYLRTETATSVGQYTFFIALIALAISPMLFTASYHVLVLIKEMVNKLVSGGMAEITNIQQLAIDIDQYRIFVMIATGVTAFFAAYIMAVIKEGSAKRALKSIVVYIIVSMGSFWIFFHALGFFFSNFLIV